MSLQTFKDMKKFVNIYKLDAIVQSFPPKGELKLRKGDEQIDQFLQELFEIIDDFVKRENAFSTNKGILEWLDLVHRTLDLLAKVIETVGEKNYKKYDEETRWFMEFAVSGMVESIQRVQKWIRKEAGIFSKTRRKHNLIKQHVSVVLSQLMFSLLAIIVSIIEVEEGKIGPQELYDAVGEALYQTRKIY